MQTIFDHLIRIVLQDKPLAPEISYSHRNISTCFYHMSSILHESESLAQMLSAKMQLLISEVIKRKETYLINMDLDTVQPLSDYEYANISKKEYL